MKIGRRVELSLCVYGFCEEEGEREVTRLHTRKVEKARWAVPDQSERALPNITNTSLSRNLNTENAGLEMSLFLPI
jgi:hypothetical protein